MESSKHRVLLAASVAGMLAALQAVSFAQQAQAVEEDGKAPCYGINKCQGVGGCGGKGHSCAGQNACKGQGYLELSKDDCLRIEGGRLSEEPEQPDQPAGT